MGIKIRKEKRKTSLKGVLYAASPSVRTCTLAALFFMGMFVASLAMMVINPTGRTALLWGSVIQDCVAFLAPAFLYAMLIDVMPCRALGLSSRLSWRALLGVILVFTFSVPAMNRLVAWNEALTFPGPIERLFRTMEENAGTVTELILGDTSAGGLVGAIVVIGLLAPLSEEALFRGALQRSIFRKHPHVDIWTVALIFSLLHFQPYGFVPRMLLGAWFGYLLYWTGSLWVPVAAHALNNTVTVVAQWLVERGALAEESINAGAEGSLAMPLVSLALTALTILIGRRLLFKTST